MQRGTVSGIVGKTLVKVALAIVGMRLVATALTGRLIKSEDMFVLWLYTVPIVVIFFIISLVKHLRFRRASLDTVPAVVSEPPYLGRLRMDMVAWAWAALPLGVISAALFSWLATNMDLNPAEELRIVSIAVGMILVPGLLASALVEGLVSTQPLAQEGSEPAPGPDWDADEPLPPTTAQ